MEITLNNKAVFVELIRKPNKNIYMRFKDENTLSVTCNKYISEKEIKQILEEYDYEIIDEFAANLKKELKK